MRALAALISDGGTFICPFKTFPGASGLGNIFDIFKLFDSDLSAIASTTPAAANPHIADLLHDLRWTAGYDPLPTFIS